MRPMLLEVSKKQLENQMETCLDFTLMEELQNYQPEILKISLLNLIAFINSIEYSVESCYI